MKNNKGIIVSGNAQLHAHNVATGDGATIYHNQDSASLDYERLAPQLTSLRKELALRASTPEQYVSVSQVARAEQSVKDKDSNSILKHLKEAGAWILEVAKEIGVDVITDLLKKSIYDMK